MSLQLIAFLKNNQSIIRALISRFSIQGVNSIVYVMIPEITPKKYNNYMGLSMVFAFMISIAIGGTVSWLMKSYMKAQLILSVPLLIPLVAAYL